jgi:acetylornithine deacetylase
MVFAARALAEAGPPPGLLRLALTADEEAGSRMGAGWLAARIEPADAVLVGEPTGIGAPWEYVGVVARGISCFRVVVRGTQMHSSLSDRLPSVNASVALARVLAAMAERFVLTEGATVNLGVTLRGGVYFGVYPGEAEAGVDVRTVPGMTLQALEADVGLVLERLRREDPELEVEAEWEPELTWFPPSAIDESHPLVLAARGASRDVLGRDVPIGTMPAFTDGTNWALGGIVGIPALGPGLLPLAHRPNEYVAVREIVEAARIYALTALRYLSAATAG